MTASPRVHAPYHHGNLRAALLGAALEILEHSGVAGLSLRAVARGAGVSHSAPYNHFADREALLAAVATEGFRRLGAAMGGARDPAADPRAQLHHLASAYVDFALAHAALYRLMFGGAIQDRAAHPELLAADQAIAATAREATAACLRRSARRSVPVETASAAGWALVHGMADLLIDDHIALPSGRPAGAAFRDEVATLFTDALIPEDALGLEPTGERGGLA